MNLIQKLAAGCTGSLLLLGAVSPVFAVDAEISGNGVDSTNLVKVSTNCTTVVEQKNYSYVGTNINVQQNTGGNIASGNTGGDTTIDSGDNSATITVAVSGNSNTANVNPCCCVTEESQNVTITGNGVDSFNKAWVTQSNTLVETQKNKKKVSTWISAKQNTGKNKAKWNTGGSTGVGTGGNTVDVTVAVEGDVNTLNP